MSTLVRKGLWQLVCSELFALSTVTPHHDSLIIQRLRGGVRSCLFLTHLQHRHQHLDHKPASCTSRSHVNPASHTLSI